jgi:signal transduction histidine kinase
MKAILKRYGLPMAAFIGLLALSLLIKWLFKVSLNPVVPMIGVLVAASWYAGRGPGLMLAVTFESLITVTNRLNHVPDTASNTIARLILFLLIAIFVSSRRQAEDRLRKALAHEVAAYRLRLEFLATVSHEIRTPLTTIRGWAQMLATIPLNPTETRKAVNVIERSAKTLLQSVEDILDTSRISLGVLHLRPEPVLLEEIVSNTVAGLQLALDGKQLKLHTALTSVPITGDPVRLQQICWNILANAVKFTPRGGELAVKLYRDSDHARLRVADTGIGIEPEFLPYVFEPFRQCDSSDTRSYGGLGLGLSITKKLVELHGGSISVSSVKGSGTEVEVSLPLIGLNGHTRADLASAGNISSEQYRQALKN